MRRLTVHDLQVFLAVSETGGIRKASISLGMHQSAVTRRIQRLEDALGVSLFERNQAGARLTSAGWDFSKQTRHIVNDLKIAVASAHTVGRGRHGHLRFGLIASLSRGVLRDVVSEFIDRHPKIEVSFAEADRNELMTLLSHRLLDVVFAAGDPASDNGDSLLLTREQVYLAVSRSHPLAARASVRWGDFEDASFVVSTEEPGPEICDYILRRISDLGRPADVHHHRLDREGIMNLVGLGLGVSPMCEHWCGVRYPDVVFLPLVTDGLWETIPFSLSWLPENDNPALRRFLSLAREAAKAGVASSEPS